MKWTLAKEFKFEAAHYLPHHDGACRRLHGHSWVGWVYCQGDRLETDGAKQGMVIDYSDIKRYLKPLVDNYLDHHYLNETTGLPNPTSEALAQWIFDKLQEVGLPGLVAVEIQETCTSRCIFTPLSEFANYAITKA